MNRIRNPFNRRPPISHDPSSNNDENVIPPTSNSSDRASLQSSFAGSRASSSRSIKKREDPHEYKLSVVNDSGIYLPPSPPEKKSHWPVSPLKARNSNHRSMLNENEPFSISRESFESYRRSFDISARSPVIPADSSTHPRASFDSKMLRGTSSPRFGSTFESPSISTTDEDIFEDVGLDGDSSATKQAPTTKKKGIFSRFGDNNSPDLAGATEVPRPGSSHRGFLPHLPGRKRGQSGQGAELGSIDQNTKTDESDGVVR